MKIISVNDYKELTCNTLIINLFEGEKSSIDFVNEHVINKNEFDGKFNSIYLLTTVGQFDFEKILIIGCGKRSEFNENKARRVVAKVVKQLNSLKIKKAVFDMDFGFDWVKIGVISAHIGNYSFDKYKNEKNNKVEEVCLVGVCQTDIDKAEIIANAMDEARNLANEPAAYATPQKLAEIAKNIENVETKIYDVDEIKEMKMGAFLAVGQGSVNPPKFIHVKYSPANPKKKVALIGKGICFDSGGLDLKPAASMLTMRDDMSGAACVLSVIKAVSKLDLPVEVHALVAACENMPDGKSYKPGDILTARNGKTIEVDNTDAEGRLTLADALCYASELGVDEVIDIATLTGACSVAFGAVCSGILGNDDEFVKEIIDKAFDAGEKFWLLPTFEEYKYGLKSEFADMRNTGGRQGGASSAGLFLKEFVKDVKWAHIDIAGTAYLESPMDEFPKGATGSGVRALINYLMSV